MRFRWVLAAGNRHIWCVWSVAERLRGCALVAPELCCCRVAAAPVGAAGLEAKEGLWTEIHEPAWDPRPCKEQKEFRHLTEWQHGGVPSGPAAFPVQRLDTACVSASCNVFSVRALNLAVKPLTGETDVSALWE